MRRPCPLVPPAFHTPRIRSLTRNARLWLGLAPLTLYLAALTLVPVISTLLLSLQTRKGSGGWGLTVPSPRTTSSVKPLPTRCW